MKTKNQEVMQLVEKTAIPDSSAEPEVAQSSIGIDLREEIRRRAYELYEQHGKEDGYDVDDWLQAGWELNTVATKAAA